MAFKKRMPTVLLAGPRWAEARDASYFACTFEHIEFTPTDSICQTESASIASTIGLRQFVTQLIRGAGAQFISGRAWLNPGAVSDSLRAK